MIERVGATPKDDRERHRSARDLFEAYVLPSRAAVLAPLRAALEAQEGPALVTGEAGVGKTWLWHRLRAHGPASWHWVDVNLSPADDPADFHRAIGHALGLLGERGAPPSRLDLADALAEAHLEGRRWALVVDEAHNLSAGVLEEIRLQCNRLGRPGGFAGLVLVGQTPLARRLATRSLAALDARLSARAHLRSLDFEEARALLDRLEPGTSGDGERFERLHRDAGGSPRRLILLSARPGRSPQPMAVSFCPGEKGNPNPLPPGEGARKAGEGSPVRDGNSPEPQPETGRNAPLLGASRPPLRLEDGLIEVGWDGERGSTESLPPREAAPSARPGDDGPAGDPGHDFQAESGPEAEDDDAIDDPYTAIQASWERERNRERFQVTVAPDPVHEPVVSEAEETVAASLPNVWAEGQHEFAPYSQLFSRLRQTRETP